MAALISLAWISLAWIGSASPVPALPILLALASAILWGAADFLGGIAARRIAAFYVVAIAHGTSLVLVLLFALASHAAPPSRHTVLFGLLGGLLGGIGLVFFFHALATAEMGLTAAIAGVLTALVPVAFSLFTEALPTPRQLTGFALAAIAIWLIAYSPGSAPNRLSLVIAIGSGIAFGGMLVLLKRANGGALWPLVSARVTSTGVALAASGLAYLRGRRSKSQPRAVNWRTVVVLSISCGLIDACGNYAYTTSALLGRLDVSAVLSSLYPAVTILLAAWLLRERARTMQNIGMALALGAVVLISV